VSLLEHDAATTRNDGGAAASRPAPSTPSPDVTSETPSRASSRELERVTDEVLVDRVRAGERAAFDAVYQRYFKRVYAFLDKRLRNRWDTEETTQEVFINVFASLDGYRGDAPFAAWIFGLTRRTLAARFRRKRHPIVPLLEEDEDRAVGCLTAAGQPEATPLERYEYVERASQIFRTLETEITDEQRTVFELHHLESVSIAEIARTLSKSEDSVKSNLYRTRKLLLAR
jgi:RNA polymerase sigma-70 factor (ECF subfamily)